MTLPTDTVAVAAEAKRDGDEQASQSSMSPAKTEEGMYDGGIVAWLQVSGSFFLFFNSWGLINTYGAFQTYYSTNLLAHETSDNIAWIGTIQGFLLMFVGVITGPLFDAGYFKWLISTGTILIVFGTMMQSICTTYWQLILAQGLVIGLGAGLLFISSIAIIPSYFSAGRSAALGVAASGSSLGGIIYPVVFHRLQPLVGFGWSVRTMGFIALGTGAIPILVMRQRSRPSRERRLLDLSAFRDAKFMVFNTATFFAFLALWIPFFYLPGFAYEVANVGQNLSFYMICLVNMGSLFGRLVSGYNAEKVGPLNVLIAVSLCCSILGFSWISIKQEAGTVVFSVLYGFFSGGIVSLPPAVVASMTSNPDVVGTRMGMGLGFVSFALLTGGPIAGAILGKEGHWLGLQAFVGALMAGAAITFVVARVMRTGVKLLVPV